MGFDVPEPFAWDESFCTDYDKLDDEHKGLFTGIFDCAGAPGDAGKLSALVSAVAAHFATEEGMMQSAGDSDFAGHKKAHDEFLAKIKGLSAPLDDATVSFAKNWLVNHIKGTDFKYKGKF